MVCLELRAPKRDYILAKPKGGQNIKLYRHAWIVFGVCLAQNICISSAQSCYLTSEGDGVWDTVLCIWISGPGQSVTTWETMHTIIKSTKQACNTLLPPSRYIFGKWNVSAQLPTTTVLAKQKCTLKNEKMSGVWAEDDALQRAGGCWLVIRVYQCDLCGYCGLG